MPHSTEMEIARLAARQHGIFTRSQALAAGATSATIARRVSSGRVAALYPGVYRVAGAPRSWEQQLLVACFAWGGRCAIARRSALAMWSMPGGRKDPIEIAIPRGRRRPAAPGIAREARDLRRSDVRFVGAIPVTSPARTLFDLARCGDIDTAEEALDDGLRRGLVTLPQLEATARRQHGRPGVKALLALIQERTGFGVVPQTLFESRLLRAIRRAGLPLPVPQYEIWEAGRLIAIPDFAYPELKIAIEADGRRWHSGKRWSRDLARRNALTTRGWRIIHVTWDALHHRPDTVIADIVAALNL